MKLHLPCALRGALLACLALACTTPAWADWSGNSYIITDGDLASGTFNLSTAGGNPDGDGWFLRTSTANDGSGVADGATSASIGVLTLAKPDPVEEGDKYTLTISGHWSVGSAMFTNLSIGSIQTNAGDFTQAAPVTVAIGSGNTVNLGDLTGLAATAPITTDDIRLSVAGTLNIAFSDFLSLTSTTGSDHQVLGNNGNLTLLGSWDVSTLQAGTIRTGLTGYENIDLSRVTVTGVADGMEGKLSYDKTTGSIALAIATANSAERFTDVPANPPKAEHTMSGSGSIPITSESLGALSSEVNASEPWVLHISGTLTNPGEGNTTQAVILSTAALGSANAAIDYGKGGFALYVTADGSLVLRNSDAEFGTATLLSSLSEDGTTTWVSGSFDLYLEYKREGNYGWTLGVVKGEDVSGITLNNGTEDVTRWITTGMTSIVFGDDGMHEDTLDNLNTRLPGGSKVTVQISGGRKYWRIKGDVDLNQLLNYSHYVDNGTGLGAKADSTDIIRFDGGRLTTEDWFDDVNLVQDIQIISGSNAIVKFAPGKGVTINVSDGEGALNNNNGLSVLGNDYSRVVLMGLVTNTAPENVIVGARNTLEFQAASSISEFVLDASKNMFDSEAYLYAGSGIRKLTFKAATDAANPGAPDTIAELANKNSGGTVRIENDLTASERVYADVVQVATDSVLTTPLLKGQMNNITLETNATLQAPASDGLNVNTRQLVMWNGATLDVGSGQLAVSTFTDLQGTLKSSGIEVTTAAYADINGMLLTADSFACDSIGMYGAATITSNAPATFELHDAKNVTINATGDTEVQFSGLNASSITVTGGGLAMSNSVLQGSTPVVVDNGAATVSNSVFKDGSTLSAVNGAVTLTNTFHDGTSHITGGSVSLTDTTLSRGTTITVGSSSYTLAATASDTLTLSGATAETMPDGLTPTPTLNITNIFIDTSAITSETTETGVLYMEASNGIITLDQSGVTLISAPGMRSELDASTGNLMVKVIDATDEILAELVTTGSTATVLSTLSEAYDNGAGGAIEDIYNDLRDTSNLSLAQRRAILGALSSSSITMLADSQRRGVTHTISNLRNRVIQMGNQQYTEPETNIHAWISADGSNLDVDNDGATAGYRYETWGGTVGMHADVGNFSFGAAVSAAYGELTSSASDRAEGDHDTVSFNLFARHQHSNWVQMGILSFARNELDMVRSIHTYKASGDTSGHSITAYYEAGYTVALDEEGAQVLQPLVSLMLTSARMGDFSETGSIGNAGLYSDGDDYFYGSVGAGARYQIVLGTNVNDRIAFLELRAKVVADFGDDTHEATVSFNGAPGSTFVLRGAEVGNIGLQLGAGLSVPFGTYTTLFADVDTDYRDCATSVSGSVGVRVEF